MADMSQDSKPAVATSTAKPMKVMRPADVAQIKNLELRAKVIVEGFLSGLHRSPYHGFSVEFTDYRQYSPGDDLRYLDWKLLARADRKYIKRFEDETNLRSYLLVDYSRSMDFKSATAEISKIQFAQSVAAGFAYFLNRQRDAVGALTFSDKILQTVPPRFRAGHLRRLMLSLEMPTEGSSTDLSVPLTQLTHLLQKRGLVIFISDFLAPVSDLDRDLGYLRSIGHDVVLLRVLDPAERELKLTAATMLRDLETGKQIYVDPAVAAKDYSIRFSEHERQIQSICDSYGVNFLTATTNQSFSDIMLQLVQIRAGNSQRSTGGNTPQDHTTLDSFIPNRATETETQS